MEQHNGRNTLVIIDDEPNVVKALTRLLTRDGYRIHGFTRPLDAIELLTEVPVGVIITDQCMPQMEGTDLLAAVKKHQPHAVNIIISAYSDDAVNGLESCRLPAYHAIPKPWDDETVRKVVAEGFERYRGLCAAGR